MSLDDVMIQGVYNDITAAVEYLLQNDIIPNEILEHINKMIETKQKEEKVK